MRRKMKIFSVIVGHANLLLTFSIDISGALLLNDINVWNLFRNFILEAWFEL